MKKKKILIIGGAGYVGTVLTKVLLDKGYQVTVYDLFIYGNHLPKKNEKLRTVIGDVRDIKKINQIIKGHDTIIHLACISNDPSFELNPSLGREINYECFEPLVKSSKNNGVQHFIYASSSSVYGIKENIDVTEETSLEPLTDYSKFKVRCEEILLSKTNNNFIASIIRPATVCGYSPRQRLDLVVNILTNLAYHNKVIKVFGGAQLRPNIHIADMVNSYICILESEEELIKDQIFNAGFENYSVEKLAVMVKKQIKDKVEIEYVKSNDDRSYHINSKKIERVLNFKPQKSIFQAISDLISAFDKKIFFNSLSNDDYFNIKKMQKINLT